MLCVYIYIYDTGSLLDERKCRASEQPERTTSQEIRFGRLSHHAIFGLRQHKGTLDRVTYRTAGIFLLLREKKRFLDKFCEADNAFREQKKIVQPLINFSSVTQLRLQILGFSVRVGLSASHKLVDKPRYFFFEVL